MHAFNPALGTQEVEAAGSLLSGKPPWSTRGVPGQTGLHRKPCLGKKEKRRKENIIIITKITKLPVT